MSELWSAPLPLVVLSLVALVALGLFAMLPRRAASAPSLALFRSLLPSWRFFEQINPVPALEYRVALPGEDWGEWRAALTPPARTASSLWLNAAGNLHLACQSLVEHLVANLEEVAHPGQVPAELTSYRLVCALIEQRVRTALPSRPLARFQFRLAPADPEQALFLSDVHGGA